MNESRKARGTRSAFGRQRLLDRALTKPLLATGRARSKQPNRFGTKLDGRDGPQCALHSDTAPQGCANDLNASMS